MLVIEKPTPDEMEHCWELLEIGAAFVEMKTPIAEIAPTEGRDGEYHARYELHGDRYAIVHFIPQQED